ncbi:putative PPE family protein PPE42 [Mycobacterium marinum]|nr:PPE family protein [Mycobacterium pseudoshottsii]RFZ60395.1 putative PPE family protein PPE42 [Mycobacterium marinum]
MNFSVLPPEVNSALIFTGPGAEPMRTAATAWGGMAVELDSAADSFASVTSGLVGGAWQGASSVAMGTAAAFLPRVAERGGGPCRTGRRPG